MNLLIPILSTAGAIFSALFLFWIKWSVTQFTKRQEQNLEDSGKNISTVLMKMDLVTEKIHEFEKEIIQKVNNNEITSEKLSGKIEKIENKICVEINTLNTRISRLEKIVDRRQIDI